MKKLLAIIYVILGFGIGINSVSAQFVNLDYNSPAVESFTKNTLVLVEQADSSYNRALRQSAAQWKLTKVEILSPAAALKKATDRTRSFLIPLEVSVKAANGIMAKHYFIAMVNGGRKTWTLYTYNDVVAYVPVDHFGNEKNLVDVAFRLPVVLGSLQDAFRTAKDKKVLKGKNGTLDAFVGIYNRRAVGLKSMTLLVPQMYLDKTAKDAFTKQYTYPSKMIADFEALKAAMVKPAPKTAILLISRSLNKHIFVLDVNTGKVLYSDLYTSDNPLNAADLARFCRVVQGK
ncbi:MAG: hypothetical protein RI894_1117 [Bacteroidota bacterium]